MHAIRARLAALAAGLLVAALASWGVAEIDADGTRAIADWMDRTFEVVMIVAYAVVHPWLQKRWNPTGAFTTEAARKLERAAGVNTGP